MTMKRRKVMTSDINGKACYIQLMKWNHRDWREKLYRENGVMLVKWQYENMKVVDNENNENEEEENEEIWYIIGWLYIMEAWNIEEKGKQWNTNILMKLKYNEDLLKK